MLLKQFRDQLLDQILTFLWGEWNPLGIPGSQNKNKGFLLDPEALLVFSLQLSRYEPRLFDEILGWLIENGHWLDASRLRRILQGHDLEITRVIGAVLQSSTSYSSERKWKNLVHYCQALVAKKSETRLTITLFKDKSGQKHPAEPRSKSDPDFMLFNLSRPKIHKSRATNAVPVNAQRNIRFLLRSLLGVGGRSECILYLLTHEGGRIRDIADGAGLFWLSVQQLVDDLIVSGLVSTRQKGKKIEYWLSHERWWNFLTSSKDENKVAPKWINWITIYSAMLNAWRSIDSLVQQPQSDYITGSKLRDCVEHLSLEFARAGLDIPPLLNGKTTEIQLKILTRLFDKVINIKQK